MQTCNQCYAENPQCFMQESNKGEEKLCMDCSQIKSNNEMATINDVDEWWKQETQYYFTKRKINIAVEKIQKWWKKYLRSDQAKYYWCERILDFSDYDPNYYHVIMINYMEQIVTHLNEPAWTGSPRDNEYMNWMLDNLESAQGAYNRLPEWWNWSDIRFKTDPIIWHDFTDSDSE